MKSICVVTGTRAEFGLLSSVIKLIDQSPKLKLQLIATGMHLSPEFGLTISEIEEAGLSVNYEIEMLLSADTPSAITKAMGVGLIGFADALRKLNPDLLLVLGDRFEIFTAVVAAMNARIPIAHIHGGEATEGLVDEACRHSITKMAHIHFVAAEDYRRRVIQLGEQPARVFNVGALGVDGIDPSALLSKEQLTQSLGIDFLDVSILVTFHPVTLEDNTSEKYISELLAALDRIGKATIIFTMPNADADGRVIIEAINEFVSHRDHAYSFNSLGALRYLSCVSNANVVVGNSSSGLIEVPALGKPTVNIGERQRGRLRGGSVIDCGPDSESITRAIAQALTAEFQSSARDSENPYGSGGASKAIVRQLERVELNGILKKEFFDITI